MWFGEFRYLNNNSHWNRISCLRKTQEQVKADCRKFLESNRNISQYLEFRTVAYDGKNTVYQESKPPHARRMQWKDVP